MSPRPIIFSAPMVRAILADRKRVTRRVVREPGCARIHGRHSIPERHFADGPGGFAGPNEMYLHWAYGGGDYGSDVLFHRLYSPYGEPGEALWVREAFAHVDDHREHGPACVQYRADVRDDYAAARVHGPWRSPIYMPRWASRITLVVESVRVERLHEITEEDVSAEGIDVSGPTVSCAYGCGPSCVFQRFGRLWDEINGKRAPWGSNPWVFRIAFRRSV